MFSKKQQVWDWEKIFINWLTHDFLLTVTETQRLCVKFGPKSKTTCQNLIFFPANGLVSWGFRSHLTPDWTSPSHCCLSNACWMCGDAERAEGKCLRKNSPRAESTNITFVPFVSLSITSGWSESEGWGGDVKKWSDQHLSAVPIRTPRCPQLPKQHDDGLEENWTECEGDNWQRWS